MCFFVSPAFHLLSLPYHLFASAVPGAVWACYGGCKSLPDLNYSICSARYSPHCSQRLPIQQKVFGSVQGCSDRALLGLLCGVFGSVVECRRENNIISVEGRAFINLQGLQRLKQLSIRRETSSHNLLWIKTTPPRCPGKRRTFENRDQFWRRVIRHAKSKHTVIIRSQSLIWQYNQRAANYYLFFSKSMTALWFFQAYFCKLQIPSSFGWGLIYGEIIDIISN